MENVSEECNEVSRDNCYESQLPYKIWYVFIQTDNPLPKWLTIECSIVTNSDNTDGYLDYANKHRDFNEDGCSKDGWANPGGASKEVTCTFPCD